MIQLIKQSLSNLEINNEQAIIDLDLEKNQALRYIQGIKRSKEEIDSRKKKINLKKETNL